jgi:hypothetical protein
MHFLINFKIALFFFILQMRRLPFILYSDFPNKNKKPSVQKIFFSSDVTHNVNIKVLSRACLYIVTQKTAWHAKWILASCWLRRSGIAIKTQINARGVSGKRRILNKRASFLREGVTQKNDFNNQPGGGMPRGTCWALSTMFTAMHAKYRFLACGIWIYSILFCSSL